MPASAGSLATGAGATTPMRSGSSGVRRGLEGGVAEQAPRIGLL